MSATVHASVGNLLRLNVLVQFLLAIFQTHREIGWPLDAPKEIEVIAETLALIERGHGTKKPVLPLKGNGGILKRRCFLVRCRLGRRPWFLGTRRLPRTLTFRRCLAQKEKLGFSKLEIFAQRNLERCHSFDDPGFFRRSGYPARDNDRRDRCSDKFHPSNETASRATCQYTSYRKDESIDKQTK